MSSIKLSRNNKNTGQKESPNIQFRGLTCVLLVDSRGKVRSAAHGHRLDHPGVSTWEHTALFDNELPFRVVCEGSGSERLKIAQLNLCDIHEGIHLQSALEEKFVYHSLHRLRSCFIASRLDPLVLHSSAESDGGKLSESLVAW
jgi:hypothetical protein